MGHKEAWIADGAFGIPFCGGFCNRPYCLRCDFAVCQLCFPSFKCSFLDHSPDISSDPVYCRFACWIPVSCHNIMSFLSCFIKRSRPGNSYLRSKIVVFLVDSLYAEATETAETTRCFISFIRRVNWGILIYDFRGEALKQFFFSWI
jgi:hypothetical protein